MLIIDMDDMGCNKVISDMCQSHDCRDKLDEFHYINPNFKATLFAIPSQMTYELLDWCKANNSWIELAVHGFTHSSNYECERMSYEEFADRMDKYEEMFDDFFVKIFKAPGWQIGDACYEWLNDNDWKVADQSYNNSRRPRGLSAYVNNNGDFEVYTPQDKETPLFIGKHYHTWDCVGNGVYELSEQIKQDITGVEDFKFISEVLSDE